MALLECCRLLLYLIEWIWTTVVLGIFPSQLKKDAPTVDGTTEGICLFNMNVGQSRCNYGVSNLFCTPCYLFSMQTLTFLYWLQTQMAWAAVAFVVLTVTIIWYALEYCSSIQLPGNVETTIFIWLSLWWVCFPYLY